MDAGNASRRELLKRIDDVSFTVTELDLFLNTHPSDPEALGRFREASKKRSALLLEYGRKYGPLTIDYAMENGGGSWNWTQTPWPWQEGDC